MVLALPKTTQNRVHQVCLKTQITDIVEIKTCIYQTIVEFLPSEEKEKLSNVASLVKRISAVNKSSINN